MKKVKAAPVISTHPALKETERLARERIAHLKATDDPVIAVGAAAESNKITAALAEVEALLQKAEAAFQHTNKVLEDGRAKGRAARKLAAQKNREVIERAIDDLFKPPHFVGADMSNDEITDFLHARQSVYKKATLKGLVKTRCATIRRNLKSSSGQKDP